MAAAHTSLGARPALHDALLIQASVAKSEGPEGVLWSS